MTRLDAGLNQPVVGPPDDFLTDLDPALPGLARALDPPDVARRFERRWPGPGPPRSITSCSTQHIRWTPGTECIATYRLKLAPAPPHPDTTIGAVAVSPRGGRHFLFDTDPDLPGLMAAIDARVMGAWLAERLGRAVDSCAITPVSYRPGRRCVLRYELSCGGDAIVLYGKLLAGNRAADLASTIDALGRPIVPPLLGLASEWQLVIQADAGRRTLTSDAFRPTSIGALSELAACGRLLGRLHARSGPPGRLCRIADDCGGLVQYLAAAERVSSRGAALFSGAIERLRTLDDSPSPAVPSHGAFRTDQVCFGPAGPSLIDLDRYCWAEPARDMANFLAYLRWRTIRRRETITATANVRTAMLSGYMAETGLPLDPHRLRVFEATSLLKIAGRRYRRLAVDEWDCVPDLIEAALDRLDAGLGTL